MLLLNALEASDTAAHLRREGLDVTGGTADEGAKSSLDHLNELWVLGEDGGSGGAIKILYDGELQVSYHPMEGYGRSQMAEEGHIPSLMLSTPGCWACEEMGAF